VKWLKRAVMTIATLVVAGAAFIYFAFPTYTHRFRLTFEIDDNGQTKVGTGVITVRDTDNDWLLAAQTRWMRDAVGPPPWVDLGDRGILIPAIMPMYPMSGKLNPVAMLSFVGYLGAKYGSPNITKQNIKQIRTASGIREIPNDQLPQFIWFSNPLDRNSARPVAPDEFETVIGPGIRFVRMYVEITTDEPDMSLYGRLPWLKKPGEPGYNQGQHIAEFQVIGGMP